MERNALLAMLSIVAALGVAWLISRRRHRRISRLAFGLAPGAPSANEGRIPPLKGDCKQCHAVGMDEYIAKPIRPLDLALEVERFIRPTVSSAQNLPPPYGDDCIDWPTIWANLEGDQSLFSELVSLFLDALPSELEAIHHAVDNKLAYHLERLVHRLKGAVGNFAAKPAFDAAVLLEEIARSGDWERVPLALEIFEHEIQRLECTLREWTNNHDQNGVAGPPLTSPPAPDSNAGSRA